ncbi:MAG TPA: tripartite tricarboxylate transporter substrate binding protein [Herbaspirillum sp.]|jgi:tripartite-type tricarboxylate transporter receptor subunit TctC
MTRTKSLAAAAIGLLCAFALPTAAQAQTYPSHPITFVVPYTPGTTADVLARLLGAKITQQWKVPVIVDNRTGASGIIGTQYAFKAAPDGYTFLFAATSYGTLAATTKLPYDAAKGFTPVSLLGTSAFTLLVNNKFPAKDLKEFIAQIKKQPGVVNYASPGPGSSQHLAMELFKQETGTDMTHVPYKGSAGALNDLLGGHVQASVVALQTATPLAKGGEVRMLATMGRTRAPTFPQVPTMVELGYPNLVVETWYGVMAPAGMPAPLAAKMSAEIDQLLKLPEIKDAMAKQGVDPAGGTPDKLAALVARELKLWNQVVARGKIELN